jgi:tetratricopeptide (TPR) repeat protein
LRGDEHDTIDLGPGVSTDPLETGSMEGGAEEHTREQSEPEQPTPRQPSAEGAAPVEDPTREYESMLEVLQDAERRDAEEDVVNSGEVDADLVRELGSDAGRSTTVVETAAEPTGELQAPPSIHPIEYWDELTIQLHGEASATSSPRRAAALLFELGRIHEDHLGQPDAALDYYRESHGRFAGLPLCCRALVRQLLARGEHAACLPVLEAELNAVSAVPERVAILAERAMIELVHLSDPQAALDDLERAQKMDPEDPVVNDLMIEIHRQRGEMQQLEGLVRRRARACTDTDLCSAMLCEVAHIREESFGDVEGAGTLYRTALNMAPQNLHALHALLRTARNNRDYPTVAKLCEALAEVESGPAAAAAYWAAARIYRDRLRNSELAIAALEKAVECSPDDRALLVDLADLYEKNKKWDRLALTLERAANLSGDRSESAVLFTRLGQIRHERLQDSTGAVDALRQATTLSPDSLPAHKLLGRLYARLERWEELLGLLSDELETFSDPIHRAAIAYRVGNVYETRLSSLELAADAYTQALEFQPGFRPALRGVSRVYIALDRYEDLVASYERELGQTADREERLLLLRRISDTWERKLGDPAAALGAYERLVAIEPSNPFALRALRRLYTLGNRWRDLVGVLRADAEQAQDRWRRVSLLTEAAEILDRQLGDHDGALESYLEVLELSPCHQPALMAVGRILFRAGRHDELLKLHQRELDHVDEPEHRVWLLMKMGRLLSEKLGRLDEAATVYNEAMNLSAQASDGAGINGPQLAAADQLVRIFRRTDNHSGMLQVLQAIPVPESGRARSLHHRRVAEVLQHGQRPALAVEHLRRALDASDDDAALYLLASIYASIGDRQSLINLHLKEAKGLEDPLGIISVHHKLARLWGEAEYDLERAVTASERILQIDPRNQVALHQLELQLARLERWSKLTGVLELSREPSEDLDYKVACALEIAAIKEDRLDDLPGAAHSSFEVLERDPTHPEALATLERYHRRTGNLEGLIQVLSRHLELAQSTSEQAAVLASIGATHASGGDLEAATKAFRTAVQTAPAYLPAVRGWLQAARNLGDNASIAEALEAEAEASHDTVRRAASLFEAGIVWHKVVDGEDRAVQALQKVLLVDPLHQEAMDELTALFTARKQWQELVEQLRQWVEHLEDPRRIKKTLARIADLQRARLGDLGGARKTLHRALEIAPGDQSLLTTLGELCRAEADWEALVRVNLRLLELTSDPIVLKALHFELGTIWEEKLPDTARAIAGYQRVLELDPSDLGALTRLSSLLLRERDWKGAAHTTKLLLQRDDDRTRVKGYHLRLAGIYSDGFKDHNQAVESCRRALSLDPGDLEATETMARLLYKAGDGRALDAHLASTLAVHRARLDRDPFRVESYQALLKAFEWQKSSDPTYVVQSVLAMLGAATKAQIATAREMRRIAPPFPSRPLTVEEVEEVLAHPDERGALHRVLVTAEAPLRKLFPHLERSVAKPERLSPRAYPELADLVNRIRKALGGVHLAAYLVDGGSEAMRVEDTATPTLYVGRDMKDELGDEDLAFLLARQIAHIRLRHPLYTRFDPGELGKVVAAVLAVVCHSFAPPFRPTELETLQLGFHKALNKRVRRQLESPALELSDRNIDPACWRAAMQQSEDRVALAVCGDLPAALGCVLRDESLNLQSRLTQPDDFARVAGPRLRQLLNFAVSEEYLTLRERVGMDITTEG